MKCSDFYFSFVWIQQDRPNADLVYKCATPLKLGFAQMPGTKNYKQQTSNRLYDHQPERKTFIGKQLGK
jgi:hypothetical protein